MYSIALTGSKSSGKSTVSNMLSKMGVPIFDHDLCLKFLLNFDINTQEKIRKALGDNAFMGSWLNTAFYDSGDKLNKLIMCAEDKSFELFNRWKNNQKSKYVIFVSSIIFERKLQHKFDSIINVYAPKSVRAKRVTEMYNDYQMSFNLNTEYDDILKNRLSNFVIHSYDGVDVIRQLNKIDDRILKGDMVGKLLTI